jgi:flagellar basal-body rod modification protein FlgD
MTDPISGVSAATTAAAAASSNAVAGAGDQFGKDTFLKLLVAQLKYQNPMSPTDGTEFIAQTAQFTMVEKLEELVQQATEAATSDRLSAAASFLGKKVAYNTTDGDAKVGVVAGFTIDPSTGPVLRVGKDDVPLVMVRAVSDASTPTTAPAPATPTAPATTPPTTDPATDGSTTTTPTPSTDPNASGA